MPKNHPTVSMTDYVSTAAQNLVEHTHTPVGDIASHHGTLPLHIAVRVVTNSCVLREGLVQVIGPHLNLKFVEICGAQRADQAQIPTAAHHVVLIDGGLGQAAILHWINHWREQVSVVFVVVVELMNDVELILACIEAGAHGYTLQGAASVEVATAINDVLHGRAHCAPDVTARIFARLAACGRSTPSRPPSTVNSPKVPFTKREREVLQYLARDYSNQAIATQLVIEVRTVKHHVHNILEKLQLQHRWDAARLALECGWVTDRSHDANHPREPL